MISRAALKYRGRFMQALRCFFQERGYLEVDTPIRLPVVLPEADIHPFACEGGFLQTSPECWMKRLLAAGCEKIFQICHCFRKDEQGRLHRPEFTMLEWYHRDWSYRELMQECEALLVYLGNHVGLLQNSGLLRRDGQTVALEAPFRRLPVHRAFAEFVGLSPEEALASDSFDALLVGKIEPQLGWDRPVFLVDYPRERASLARLHPDNPALAERFELYIGGIELANGFSELTDPHEQKLRFAREIETARKQGDFLEMPVVFLDALDALPPSAGVAMGVDRLLMLFQGQQQLARVMVGGDENL